MCLPACTARLAAAVSRRAFLRRAGVLAGAAAWPALLGADEAPPPRTAARLVIDLTHTLGPDFPSYLPDSVSRQPVRRLGPDKYNAFRWQLYEHVGTHLDAPLHFSDGESADRIPAAKLVGPLVVVDIRARAAQNADALLTPMISAPGSSGTAASPKAPSSPSTAVGTRWSAMPRGFSAGGRTRKSICPAFTWRPCSSCTRRATSSAS